MSQRIFSTEELLAVPRPIEAEVETEEYQPEGVIIADMVEALWLGEQEEEYSAAEERRAIAMGKAQVRREAFEDVLRAIYDRFGYAPRIFEEVVLCRS